MVLAGPDRASPSTSALILEELSKPADATDLTDLEAARLEVRQLISATHASFSFLQSVQPHPLLHPATSPFTHNKSLIYLCVSTTGGAATGAGE